MPMSSMPPSPSQRSMSLIRPAISPTVVPGWLTVGPAGDAVAGPVARSHRGPGPEAPFDADRPAEYDRIGKIS